MRLPLRVLGALCIFMIAGMSTPVPAADDITFDPQDSMCASTGPLAGINFQIGEDLETLLPDGMSILGKYEVEIDPDETLEIQPLNYDELLEVDSDTPIGALDTVSRTEDLDYSTVYFEDGDILGTWSIGEYVFQQEPTRQWWVLHEIEGDIVIETGINNHTLTDGETIWFVYLEPGETFEGTLATAEVGLSATVHFHVSPPPDNLTDVIAEDENLTILAEALTATNMTENLSAEGPFTVFAPEDAAFEALGNETLDELLKDTENLTSILEYHVVQGNYTEEDLQEMANETENATLTTILGENLTLNLTGDRLRINDAEIIAPDINATNGIAHIIDRVLMPENVTEEGPPEDNVTPTPTPGADGNRTQQGENLVKLLPDTMERLGEFNVTIRPEDSFEVQPINLNNTISVDRNNPLGALDAVSEAGEVNYSAWYDVLYEALTVDSIEGIEERSEWYWVVYFEPDEGAAGYTFDVTNHTLSDGEIIWFIYINPKPENRIEEDLATATHGLSITTTFAPQQSVVEMIDQSENLTTLAILMQIANLTETLQTGGPYTVFAPDNMAFRNLGNDRIENLIGDTDALSRMLNYHVVRGEYSDDALLNMTEGGNETSLENLAGENLTLNHTEDGELMVNGARVVTPDLEADNGVVHVIDAVLNASETSET